MIDEKKLIKETQKCFVNNSIHKNDLAEVISNLPRVGEWIPCSEPPKYTGDYLVIVGINRDGIGMYDEVRTANYNTFYESWTVHEDWKNAIGTNPIAWMPLPESYEVGDQE